MTEEAIGIENTSKTISSPRTGVILCECGGRISGFLDIKFLLEQTKNIPAVVFASKEAYPCNSFGLDRLRKAIVDHELERLLIAGCTPRLVEKLFRDAAAESGLERTYLDVVDIREHCAYVHPDNPDAALMKALDLIKMGVARLSAITLPHAHHTSIQRSALIIGSDLSGLTVGLALGNEDVEVTIVEEGNELGEGSPALQEEVQEIIPEKISAVQTHPKIHTLLNSHVEQINGVAGNYEVILSQGDERKKFHTGAIILALGVQTSPLEHTGWFDRSRICTQDEFWHDLKSADDVAGLPYKNIVFIFNIHEVEDKRHSHILSKVGVQQSIRAKERNPDSQVTILFRDLYLGTSGTEDEAEIHQAKDLGVNFFRYRKDFPPQIDDETVDVFDPLTGQPIRIPYDKVVLTPRLLPNKNAERLAIMLNLPRDSDGFVFEERVRLRPEFIIDDGIYVVGGIHQPSDSSETLLQAYVTSSRVLRFLNQDEILVNKPVAEIDEGLCTGCANCIQICPTSAIQLRKRPGVLSLAEVDVFRCTGCGNCVVVCPVKAISLPGWDDDSILAQISAALEEPASPAEGTSHPQTIQKILAFACEWSAYSAADIAGTQKTPYPPNTRIIRLNCSARLDPLHILWAFINGAAGVFLGLCLQGNCHYSGSNLLAEQRILTLKKQLAEHDIDPRRLHIEFLSGADPDGFVKAITSFSDKIATLNIPDPKFIVS
jgi:heterodisulfide reductase subunit A